MFTAGVRQVYTTCSSPAATPKPHAAPSALQASVLLVSTPSGASVTAPLCLAARHQSPGTVTRHSVPGTYFSASAVTFSRAACFVTRRKRCKCSCMSMKSERVGAKLSLCAHQCICRCWRLEFPPCRMAQHSPYNCCWVCFPDAATSKWKWTAAFLYHTHSNDCTTLASIWGGFVGWAPRNSFTWRGRP
jgi:hypothetical protein